jgi:transcriptional accessory protein Tex/SPT6
VETVKQYTKRHCQTREDKEALQEIVHRAQLTTLSLSHPYTTEDRTEPYLAKLVKDLVKDYKGNRNWTHRNQRFSSEIVFPKGCTADARAGDIR